MIIIVDYSKGMKQKDWKPYRSIVVSQLCQDFIKEFLDQSPISQLSLLAMKGKIKVQVLFQLI